MFHRGLFYERPTRERKRARERERERRQREREKERCEMVKTQKRYYLCNIRSAYFPINTRLHGVRERARERKTEQERKRQQERARDVKQ